jgi:hypothetical protein
LLFSLSIIGLFLIFDLNLNAGGYFLIMPLLTGHRSGCQIAGER